MNDGQVASAIGMVQNAIILLNKAEKLLAQNGIMLCSVNPKFEANRKDEVHVYSGIHDLAEIYQAELEVDESLKTRDKWFMVGETKFFEIMQEDGTYR